MFPQRSRLPRASITAALSSGKRSSSKHFSIILPKQAVKGYAVIVPKKVAKLSVRRHRIKRRVLAALRSLPVPFALIVFPKQSVDTMSYKEVQKELAALLK